MFFDQIFTLRFLDGRVMIIEDLFQYFRTNSVDFFYEHMKFDLSVDKRNLNLSYSKYNTDKFKYYGNVYSECRFYMYTEKGLMVSPDLFRGEYIKAREEQYVAYYERCRRNISHGKASHNTRISKRMKTTQELRATVNVITEEGEPQFRSKRRKRLLPNAWDDRFSRKSCTWKHTKRKKQYKGS